MSADVIISDIERKAADLRIATIEAALAQFGEDGYVVLRNVFDPALIDRLHDGYQARYGSASAANLATEGRALEVGNQRFELTLEMTAPFDNRTLYANELVDSIVAPLLGRTRKLNSFTAVVSYPGAELQHIHRDHDHLFDEAIAGSLPPHAVNVAVPLIDVSLDCGPTAVWPGSHRWPPQAKCDVADAVTPELARGDCLLIDYRTMHAGMPNASGRIRPVLYLVYARPWFFDEKNHQERNPVDFPRESYEKLPSDLRWLLSRAVAWHRRPAQG